MKIILSTRNPSKAEQIKAMLQNPSIQILTLEEAGIIGEGIEDGVTLDENALKKALFAKTGGAWAMADDTGLFISALSNEPGIRAARWAGETASTEEITAYCLSRMNGITDRRATMQTVVALVSPEGEQYFFKGKCEGQLLDAPKTKAHPKMPYSPLFVPDGASKVWAEMTVDEENAISHRGQAFRQVVAFLESL